MYSIIDILIAISAVLLGFLLHEFGHREVARKLGHFAFFKAWRLGLSITLITALLSLVSARLFGISFIIAAPGAVIVIPSFKHMYYRRRFTQDETLIAAAGPIVNIILSIIGLIIMNLSIGLLHRFGIYLAQVNSLLAFFNLLPLPVLDGLKILRGNFTFWILLFAVSILLLVLSIH